MKGAILAMVVAYIMPSYGVLKRFAGQRDELTVANLKAEGVAAVAPVLAKDVSSLMGVTWNSVGSAASRIGAASWASNSPKPVGMRCSAR